MEQEKNKMEQGKSKQQRMRELVELLNRARKAYEQDNTEIMSNYEYDRLYDELEELEKELGTKMANSPTVNVGYEVVSGLPKERHERPMLSLDKTKEVERLKEFLGTKKAMISWKLDGLTIVLTYQGGELVKAVTRGNGIEGEVITNNAKVFQNVPLHIPYQGELVLRGEAVISYKDFEAINEKIEDVDAKYKNPRNLCSGSVRQLNNEITAKRNVKFFAFTLVRAEEVDFHNSRMYQMQWLKEQGFDVVEHHPVTAETIEEEVAWFAKAIGKNEIPSDGLVLVYDDIAYGQSLGTTAKFPRDSFAFKWADEIRETTLLEIEWSPSRTGLINPVAVFEPVELEGTTVSRASVHNISIMEELELGVGDTIQVYKANMIIPQIAENLTRSGVKDIPTVCPVCGGTTKISMENETKTLFCTNPECQAKHVKAFSLFVSRDAMNIEGLSATTLEKLIGHGWVRNFGDLYELEQHREDIVRTEGFGERSFDRLQAAIEKSRRCTLAKFIAGLGIPMVGRHAGRDLDRYFHGSWAEFEAAILNGFDFTQLPDFGETMHNNIYTWYADAQEAKLWRPLLRKIQFETKENLTMETTMNNPFAGKTVVATGKLEHYTRDGIQEKLISLGAHPSGAVSKKTDYLIVGEKAGSKLTKAQQLGVKTLTEQEFEDMLA